MSFETLMHVRMDHELSMKQHAIQNSYITEFMTSLYSVVDQTSRPRYRTEFGERAFSHAGPAAWNSLPDELRQAPTFNSFKRNVKTHLLALLLRFS